MSSLACRNPESITLRRKLSPEARVEASARLHVVRGELADAEIRAAAAWHESAACADRLDEARTSANYAAATAADSRWRDAASEVARLRRERDKLARTLSS